MIQDLQTVQAETGATFESISDLSVAISYGNNTAALQAAQSSCALVDRSHWGQIQVSDADRIRFLHNQSTNNFEKLQPGQGCDTVFVTSTARTIDLVTAYVMQETVLLLVSPQCRQSLLTWLDRYIFFADKVTLSDLTKENAVFSLIGPESSKILNRLGLDELPDRYANHCLIQLERTEVRIAAGSSLATGGYTLIVPADRAAVIWKTLIAVGAVPAGNRVWEQLRIEQGRPVPGRELTEDYNPLEAGLWHTISFDKGCYIGQETIARLDTYQGVKQKLWGIRLNDWVEPGSFVKVGDNKVGKLTSITETNQGLFGLAYIRTKAGGEGIKVTVGESTGEVVKVPFLTHRQ